MFHLMFCISVNTVNGLWKVQKKTDQIAAFEHQKQEIIIRLLNTNEKKNLVCTDFLFYFFIYWRTILMRFYVPVQIEETVGFQWGINTIKHLPLQGLVSLVQIKHESIFVFTLQRLFEGHMWTETMFLFRSLFSNLILKRNPLQKCFLSA